MRFLPLLAAATLAGAALPQARSQLAGAVPPDLQAKLEAMPPSRMPLRNATLASAVRLLAADAHLNFLAPPEADFTDRISSDVTMNPYDLLQLLSEDYHFEIEYRKGLWRFYRVNASDLVTRAYSLRFNNLTDVSISSSSLNSQLAAATGGSGGGGAGGMGGGGGGGGGVPRSGSSGGGGSVQFDSKESRIVSDVKKILLMSAATGTVQTGDKGARPPAAISDPIWDPDSSQLFVVATPAQHAQVEQYLQAIDRPQKLVRIAVKFVETQRNPISQVGVDWSNTLLGTGGPLTLSGLPSGGNGTVSGGNTGLPAIQRLVNLGHGIPISLLSAPAFQWTVNAIASDRNSSVVQDPVIFTANNHPVAFKATTEQPIQQGSTTFGSATAATTSQIAYLEVGTQMAVLPTLLPGYGPGKEVVLCNFSITVSSIIGQQSIGGNAYPVTSNRSFSYSVPIPNGQTLVIAGLEERSRLLNDSKVPVFGDIPVLGYAFKDRGDQVTHTTLLAFITPEIVEEPVGAEVADADLPPLRHRPFQGSEGETLSDVNRSLDQLPGDIMALDGAATPRNKLRVLNRLERISVELSLMDVRLGELKLEKRNVTGLAARRIEAARQQLTRAHDRVAQIHTI